jgi:IclR family transcriptional regulator, acetate operon repressor
MKRKTVASAARYKVDAAAKALELLSVFSFREPRLSLAELAARTGIPRATAFRLLSTLEQSGFLDKVHGAFQPGIKCFVLGNIVAGGLDLRETARPHLVALREATRETTQIAILDHWQVVYLERMLSSLSVGYMRSRAGAILPAYCTGLGKTLLAFRPEAEVRAWAATQKFAALTPRTITSAKRLLKDLAGIRERGYGLDEEEREKGVTCVAAPIFNHTGDVVAAISVAGPTERMPRALVGSDVAAAVVAAARAISIDLGAVEEGPVDVYRAAPAAHGGRR